MKIPYLMQFYSSSGGGGSSSSSSSSERWRGGSDIPVTGRRNL
jgi:hypothetical protein